MQNVSKLNNISSHISYLNKRLNRNYSFVYDQNLDRYDFFYNNEDPEDYESITQGYWGYLRDIKADRKRVQTSGVSILNSHDGYWGCFEDLNLVSSENFLKNETINTNLFDEQSKSRSANNGKNLNVKFSIENSSSETELDSPESLSSTDEDYDFGQVKNVKKQQQSQWQTQQQFEQSGNPTAKLIYDVCSSKFKIEACKRDEMKIFLQNLEDKESQLKKEILKSINKENLPPKTSPITDNSTEHDLDYNQDESSLILNSNQLKTKTINFLYFSNLNNNATESALTTASDTSLAKNDSFLSLNDCELTTAKKTNLANFKNTFNTLSKLNKSINIFNGNYLSIDKDYLDHFVSFFNVHASMNDLSDLLFNYRRNTHTKKDQNIRKTTTISLCSNILESDDSATNSKPFGWQNHLTMLFEHNNVKIGFMALVDKSVFDKLNLLINNKSATKKIDYVDFVLEANRLSSQLKLSGAQIIICLINFESHFDEQRLLNEATHLDVIFSSNTNMNSMDRVSYKNVENRWLIKSSNNFESLSLVSLSLDEFNSNKLLDIAITKYFVD
jgi:hypothetical protein